MFTNFEFSREEIVVVFIVLKWGNSESAVENELHWTCRMDECNENLIQQFSKKLEGMSGLRMTFKQFGLCYAEYSFFNTEIYSY